MTSDGKWSIPTVSLLSQSCMYMHMYQKPHPVWCQSTPADLVLHELLAGLVQRPGLVGHKVVLLLHLSQVVQSLLHLRQHGTALPTVVTQLAAVRPGGGGGEDGRIIYTVF